MSAKRNGYKESKRKRQILAVVLPLIVLMMIVSVVYKDNFFAAKEDSNQQNENTVERKVEKTTGTTPVKESTTETVANNTQEKQSVETAKEKQKVAVNSKPTDQPKVNAAGYIEGQKLPQKPTYVKGVVIVNKKYPLPASYAPGVVPEANTALNTMFAAAKVNGFELTAFSSYRSYDYQKQLYTNYVKKDGQAAADRYSARPGYSEHQTGLAFDIGEVGRQDLWLTEEFGGTPAGQWLQKHAYEYGFILRYPKGKEAITGYMYESWHFRYVGLALAKKVHAKKVTLEEYLNIQ